MKMNSGDRGEFPCLHDAQGLEVHLVEDRIAEDGVAETVARIISVKAIGKPTKMPAMSEQSRTRPRNIRAHTSLPISSASSRSGLFSTIA